MELLLDICCLYEWGPVKGERGSDKLGLTFQTKTYSPQITSPLSAGTLVGNSGRCWLRMPQRAGGCAVSSGGISSAITQWVNGNWEWS